jgi:hypothetical protein
MMATVERRMEEGMTNEEEIAEEVFKRSFIPRTLDDVRTHTHAINDATDDTESGHRMLINLFFFFFGLAR